jgi:transposase
MNTKLHAVTDSEGRPIQFFMTAGQVSDYTGAAALLGSLPKAEWLLADRGYDADWFREVFSGASRETRRPSVLGDRQDRTGMTRFGPR